MAGGLHHHHEIGGLTPVPSIRRTPLAGASPVCEQAVGGETPLSTAPAACSLFPSLPLCGTCAGTPARRCCLTLAARPELWIVEGLHDQFRLKALGCNAVIPGDPVGSKFQDLTAQIGEDA